MPVKMTTFLFYVHVKAYMKETHYKDFLLASHTSGDISAVAYICPDGVALGCFVNCNHVGGFLLALEDFNRIGLQTLHA